MYEKRKEALASSRIFYRRIGKNFIFTLVMIIVSLLVGTLGYHQWGEQTWIDSFHNASMILSGMGPVVIISTESGKIFSSFYALFSGLAFITNVGLLLAPVLHRFYHMMHMDE